MHPLHSAPLATGKKLPTLAKLIQIHATHKIRKTLTFILLLAFNLVGLIPAYSQHQSVLVADLSKTEHLRTVNRSIHLLKEGHKKGISFDKKEGEGIAWLSGITFRNGILEFDIRGKDQFQQSFVGIAFHGTNDSTFDVVYFRPFNFRADDQVRRSHAVQYVYHPEFHWQKLREEQPGKYENPVEPAPNPNEWFHVRIVVESPTVRVFVNHAKVPCLVVKQLSDQKGEKIGFWVGNNSDGDFANLTITAPR